jgi:glyoxylase-like metal-dependent hydrolase (beta-lactamase superfamily II)
MEGAPGEVCTGSSPPTAGARSVVTLFPEFENVRAISIPLPGYSSLGTANIYVVGRGPITLVDTGPKFPGSFDELRSGLERLGHNLSDVERILLTHGHLDHFGLVQSLREAAGRSIPCYIHAEDRWRVTAEIYHGEMWTEQADNLMAMVDMPAQEVEKIRQGFEVLRLLCDPVLDALPMEEGDVFEGEGYHLEVIHTPGHSTGACCFYEKRRKILFSGDSILKHITPNPFIEIQKDHLRDPNYQPLKSYLQSLDKLDRMDVRHVFPGHGAPMEDLNGIISGYREHHEERKELVWRTLQRDSRPIYHLIDDVFPFVPEGDIFLAISEILVHLELLIDEGRAELSDPGPPAYYRAL